MPCGLELPDVAGINEVNRGLIPCLSQVVHIKIAGKCMCIPLSYDFHRL
jgi:hypothetical protein